MPPAMRATCTRYVQRLRAASRACYSRGDLELEHGRAVEPTDAGSALARQEGIR